MPNTRRSARDAVRLRPLRWWWIGGAVLLVLGLGVATGFALWPRATSLTDAERERAAMEAIRTALTAAGGTAAALALLLAVRRQRTTEVALDLQDLAATDTRHDATERRVTELYTKAAEQLGSDKAPVRLARLHALERLAQGAPEHRQTIVNVLCAYLRMPVEDSDPGQERQVRLTAQHILAAHLRPDRYADGQITNDNFWPGIALDLSGASLVEFNLSGGEVGAAVFVGTTFEGDARFSATRFTGRALFTHAAFNGNARFARAVFADKAVFRSARFAGEASFRNAEFHGDTGFRDALFAQDAWFTNTAFRGQAWFTSARFDRCARLTGARFHGDTRFAEVRFAGAAWIRQVHFHRDVSFHQARFEGTAAFTGTRFDGAAGFAETHFAAAALFTGARLPEPR
ncbi:pentapeptide repeat-containing protein [Crossiella sp. SN42]|uniref:pentapeptide repeat-containing protein n=1 Tax=Crossiella sp. SN42 TaxID=2944808 RepID=UPI00207CEF86|nr:pentapeptide repeat-containing protein [Crossiella sp. SN42]MCO1577084.1 pentapeptide repeat-containing protein [Crossiella sp. SN42]